ncbi:MAG TPA: serine hydrolase domain-containing protein [Saprospiraceae bacterium]|nr:serine hydrolase domain-containing protein [Saprospiraceae bacterium]
MKNPEIFLVRQVEEHKTPSIQYRFFNKDSMLYSFHAGFADIQLQTKTEDTTCYFGYSVTKTFTAVAVLQLAEKKLLQLDQTVISLLPEFPYSHEITVRQLLSHSAGIPNPIPLSWIHTADEHASFDANRFFAAVFKKHPKTKSLPNEKFAYSNLGYVLLGQLIEKASGLRYEEYIRENIIKPLGLTASELDFVRLEGRPMAKGYHKTWSFSNALLGFLIDKSKFMEKGSGKWTAFKTNYVNGPAYGGLIGTPGAFVRFIQDLLSPDGVLIDEASKQVLFTENRNISGKPTGMCLAWFKGQLNGQDYFSHAGGGGGYYAEIRIYPALGLGSVVMFNRTGMSDQRFLDQVDRYFIVKH